MDILRGRLSSGTIASRAAKGGAWLALGSSGEQLLRLIRNMLLARVLVPEAFGTMALVLTVTGLFDSFSQVGVREAVIQDPHGDSALYLNGAWFLGVFRGICLYLMGALAAPFVARFYDRPELVTMLRLSLVSLLFQGAMSVRSFVGLKRLDLRRWILVDQLGGVIGVVCALALAVWLRNAWGLVIGFAVESLSRLVLSYVLFPYIPAWKFDRGMLKSLFRYARRMLGVPILAYLFMQVDVFFVGKLAGPAQLGVYTMAASIARIPDLIVSKFAAPVMLPAYAAMQDTVARIHSSLVVLTKSLAAIGMPLGVMAIGYGASILSVVYTPAYAEVGAVFGVLVMASVLRNLGVPFASACLATGRADVLRWTSGVRTLLVTIGMYPAIRCLGVLGAALCVLFSVGVWYVLLVLSLQRITGGRAWTVFTQLRFGLAPSLIVVASIPAARRLVSHGSLAVASIAVCALLLSYGCYALWELRRRVRVISIKALGDKK